MPWRVIGRSRARALAVASPEARMRSKQLLPSRVSDRGPEPVGLVALAGHGRVKRDA